MSELKPCPFCGGTKLKKEIVTLKGGRKLYFFGCARCGGNVAYYEDSLFDRVFETWNAREGEDEEDE